MSKGTIFVATYSVVLIVLFCVFCFLMSIVNPPPLEQGDKNTTVASTEAPQTEDSDKPPEEKLDENHYKYLRNMPENVSPEYGIEKAGAYEFAEGINPTTLEPFYLPNKNVVHVVPPLWPPTDPGTVNDTETKVDIFNDTKIPVKGRRSLTNVERRIVSTQEGSVLLKILDDSGQSRIEIKLGPSRSFGSKVTKIDQNSEKNHLFNMSMLANGSDFPKDTVIKIMPNDTVVFEEDSFVTGTYNEHDTVDQHEVNLTEEFGLNLFTDTKITDMENFTTESSTNTNNKSTESTE